jgi:L-alanine-DL-glutamate epimerase-like enolase superfamily enzyme
MTLMDDISSALKTLGDALRLGHVLDDYRYFWYEDPYADTGISASGNSRLREKIRTPLLITEHLRSLEPKVDFFLAGGTDLLRADPDFDGGITGAMKIAHAAEGLGTDVELHFCGPAHRHCMTAIRNTNYYEMGLLHPNYDITSPASGVALNYRDGLDSVDANGCVVAPDGPGLGVVYDWELIAARRVGGRKWGD